MYSVRHSSKYFASLTLFVNVFSCRLRSLSLVSDFGHYCSLMSNSIVHRLSMSFEDRRSVSNSSDDYLFRHKDASIRPSCQGCTVCGENADVLAPSPSGVLPSGDLAVVPVNVTKYIDRFCLFPDARRFTAMHHDCDTLDFINAHYGETHDTAVGASKKRTLLFNCNRASFLGSQELQHTMPYFSCPEERKSLADLSTLVVMLMDSGLLDLVPVY